MAQPLAAIGGLTAVLKIAVWCEIVTTGGQWLGTGTVAVTLEGQPKLLFARLGNVIADGVGHANAFKRKGTGDLKPYLRDFKVYKKAR